MKRVDPRKAGFSLPVVLTIVAIMTLTYAICLNSLINLRAETKLAVNRAEFERAAMTAEARLTYIVTTEPFGAATINIGAARNANGANGAITQTSISTTATINLDDTAYRFLDQPDSTTPYLASVQDEAGLFNIYGATIDQLTALFENLAGLGDQDAGNLAAEIQAYNIDPTQHQPLHKASELFSRLQDMADLVSPKAWSQIADKIVAYPDNAAFNVNTAPADVIAIVFNTDTNTAQSVVDNRAGTVIANVTDVGLANPDATKAYTFSGGRLRFTFIDPKSGLTYRSSLIFTPTDTNRPLWVENPHMLVTTPPADVSPDDLDPFPDVPDSTT